MSWSRQVTDKQGAKRGQKQRRAVRPTCAPNNAAEERIVIHMILGSGAAQHDIVWYAMPIYRSKGDSDEGNSKPRSKGAEVRDTKDFKRRLKQNQRT